MGWTPSMMGATTDQIPLICLVFFRWSAGKRHVLLFNGGICLIPTIVHRYIKFPYNDFYIHHYHLHWSIMHVIKVNGTLCDKLTHADTKIILRIGCFLIRLMFMAYRVEWLTNWDQYCPLPTVFLHNIKLSHTKISKDTPIQTFKDSRGHLYLLQTLRTRIKQRLDGKVKAKWTFLRIKRKD